MQSVLQFFEKIYNEEFHSKSSQHLFSSQVLKLYFPQEKEELLTEDAPFIPIGIKEADEINKTMHLNGNTTRLVYYSLARAVRFIALGKHKSTRFYPLFKYKAELVYKNDHYFVKIDLESKETLIPHFPKNLTDDKAFIQTEANNLIDFHKINRLADLIKKYEPEAKTEPLIMYPDLTTLKDLRSYTKTRFKEEVTYFPVGTLAIVEKENSSFTVLDELYKTANTSSHSAPLQVFFNEHINRQEEKQGIICEELNESQLTAIENSNQYIVSTISGPPGTGKSFTIANLAAEKMGKGQSVLISSKNKEALTVIEEKIHRLMDTENFCVNPSKESNNKWMKDHLTHLLGRSFKPENIAFEEIQEAYQELELQLKKQSKLEEELNQKFKRERDLLKKLQNSRITKNSDTNFHSRVIKHRNKTAYPLWSSLFDYYDTIAKNKTFIQHLLPKMNQQALEESIKMNRTDLRAYLSFLKARNKQRKQTLLEDLNCSSVLRTFPIWLVAMQDIAQLLPLQKELFDVLIVDEASQCDIPSLIPLLQRAKKVIIVGDHKQLNHISFIAKATELKYKQSVTPALMHLCEHRDQSVLDLAQKVIDPLANVQLNEHFRSQFSIISFSNKAFYNDELNILSKRPISVSGQVIFKPTGGSYEKGKNSDETAAILEEIKAITKAEKDLPKHLKTSIGVISPFRKQVDYIFQTLTQNLTFSEIESHHVMVGTAHTFQGNERDLMLISLAVDNNAVAGSFNYINRADVFNVSITRAKTKQIILYSFDTTQLKFNSLLDQFFRFYETVQSLDEKTYLSDKNKFRDEVECFLISKACTTWTDFSISGVKIDVLFEKNNDYFGIDLIGFPDETEDYYSLERYKMIERGGIKLFPLPYNLWLSSPEICKTALIDLIA